jgi:phospholipase D
MGASLDPPPSLRADRAPGHPAILDKSNDKKFSASTLLQAYGIPVWIDYRPAIAHNKVIIVDGHLTIGGSYNYTANAAKRNAENVTFTESPEVAKAFQQNWESRLEAARPFEKSSLEQ